MTDLVLGDLDVKLELQGRISESMSQMHVRSRSSDIYIQGRQQLVVRKETGTSVSLRIVHV